MITEPMQAGTAKASRSRAVFSTEDFALLRIAVLHYLNERPVTAESAKLSNLYHRLGRLA